MALRPALAAAFDRRLLQEMARRIAFAYALLASGKHLEIEVSTMKSCPAMIFTVLLHNSR